MLPIPEKFISALGVKALNEPQRLALQSGLLEGKSMVVSSPTASGKTIVAEIAMIKNFLGHGKTLYLVPLKALASEKYEEFKSKYEKLGMRIAISVGDLDSSDGWLESYDVIIASNEKADSLLRHGAKWLSSVSLIIADEIHMLNDYSRGPTLEIVLTRMRESAGQVVALSATISNAEDIAGWLGAELVTSDYRPIKLFYGVSYPRFKSDILQHVIDFTAKDDECIEFPGEPEVAMSRDAIKRKKQALVFLSTRRSAEAASEKIGKGISSLLTASEKVELQRLSRSIEAALPNPTKQCKRLSAAVKSGAAFHHAGLLQKQRKLIEDSFRSGAIKVITSTPTLAFGLNLPAWRVLIRDVKRYSGYGLQFIPVMDVMQMSGRAGRPKYDTDGEAIIISKSDRDAGELKERYFMSEPEAITSKLSNESVLRTQVLALVATETCKTKYELFEFFSKTFFAYQYRASGDYNIIEEKIEKIITELGKFGFLIVGDKDERFISQEFVPAFNLASDQRLHVTRVGKRVSELYIDPLSAWNIIQELRMQHDLAYLMMINQCIEMFPILRVRQSDFEEYGEALSASKLTNVPDIWDVDYEEYLSTFKTSLMFTDWANELTEDNMFDKYNIPPGELYSKMKNAEWMLYSAKELAVLLGRKESANRLNKLMLRIKHGVREELLPLVRIKGIGRVRARMLWKNKIKSALDIRKANDEMLADLLGSKTAKSIKEAAAPEKLR
ncbi:MAG: DEAD/DEAH box helicase [Candidatus Aenigmarchaeota archaeon]|nr:DEAD/DEAH box helicase [Candidatus Aenigmarchaeota archaeon]